MPVFPARVDPRFRNPEIYLSAPILLRSPGTKLWESFGRRSVGPPLTRFVPPASGRLSGGRRRARAIPTVSLCHGPSKFLSRAKKCQNRT
jgi:hypothetical protein